MTDLFYTWKKPLKPYDVTSWYVQYSVVTMTTVCVCWCWFQILCESCWYSNSCETLTLHMEDISEATWRHYTDVWRSFVIKEIFILVSMPDAYFYTKEFGIVMVTSLFLILTWFCLCLIIRDVKVAKTSQKIIRCSVTTADKYTLHWLITDVTHVFVLKRIPGQTNPYYFTTFFLMAV